MNSGRWLTLRCLYLFRYTVTSRSSHGWVEIPGSSSSIFPLGNQLAGKFAAAYCREKQIFWFQPDNTRWMLEGTQSHRTSQWEWIFNCYIWPILSSSSDPPHFNTKDWSGREGEWPTVSPREPNAWMGKILNPGFLSCRLTIWQTKLKYKYFSPEAIQD